MLTTTHVTINGALSRLSRGDRTGATADAARRLLPDDATRRAILWGGLAPDVGLAALSVGAAAWFPLARGWTFERTFEHVYRDLFFEDPVWVVAHNLLHAPLVLLALLAVGVRRGGRTGRWFTAFGVGCLLHSVVDVLTHHDDGPLLLFPLEWTVRFSSPVSYWDPAHGGWWLGPVDTAITLVGGGWLLVTWGRRRLAERATGRA